MKGSRKKGHGFGQRRPPLTELIQSILERYPDGGQILKELIQNADDAGATEVNFLYDNSYHGTESLENPELAKFQGPALYCHNDATFKEEDWEGIQNLMRSGKKDDPLKVGRFGIGFNSVYHITDLPGIVSGETVGFLDPHETYFTDDHGKRGVSGKRYYFDENLLGHVSRDQFSPFHGIFGCHLDTTNSYDGTLFRFPLRTTPSELSKKKYTKEMIDNLFHSLQEEASVILLFLKSVQSIKVHQRNQNGQIECVLKVEVAEDTREDVRRKRKEFLNNAKEPTITESRYIMNIQVTFGSQTESFRWLTVNQVGSTEQRIAELADELCLLPWVGIAVPIAVETNNASSGRIFCFLPLPPDVDCQTGLPVHVHGYFGLTDNRRGLVWPGAECQNTATAEWNELLLKKIAVQVYCKILEALIQDVPCTGIGQEQRSQLIYSRFPALAKVQGHWQVLLEPLFQKLILESKKLFYAQRISGNSWITLNEGILDRLQESGIASETREVILKMLLDSSQVVVTNVPPHVLEIVARYFSSPRDITPSLLRSVLKSHNVNATSHDDKVLLLDFILRDDQTGDLNRIPLLPLANKTFATFCPHSHAKAPSTSVFVPMSSCTAILLPNMSHRFLNENLPEAIRQKLIAMAANDVHSMSPTQLVPLTKEIVLQNLRTSLPSEWFNNQEKVQWIPGHPGHPSESWLKEIWNWIHSSFPDTLSPFENLPLVELPPLPTTTNKCLGVLSQHSRFIFALDGSGNILPPQMIGLLMAAGCTILFNHPSYLHHPDINSYIAPPTAAAAMSVLSRASLQSAKEHIKLSTSSDRSNLREFFTRLPESLSITKKNLLLQLPLFDTLLGSCTAVQVNGQILNAASPEFSLPSGFNFRKSDQIISSADPKAHQLLTMLTVEILQPAEVFLRYLFLDIQAISVYSLQETSTIMLWILRQMFNFKTQCKGFHDTMKDLPFVSTDNANLKKPSQLYDPNDDLLSNLFLGETNKFPSKQYNDGHVISTLKELGLRTKSMLTAGELLGVAASIASSPNSLSSDRKVQALVEVLEGNPDYLGQFVDGVGTLKDKLLQLKWLPHAKAAPESCRFPKSMPWFNSDTHFFAPTDLRSKSHALLVGSTMPILGVKMNDNLQHELRLTSDPPVHKVVAQLKAAVQLWQQQDQKKASSQFQDMLVAIYKHLSQISKYTVANAINDAALKQWIWHGTGFCSPAQVALEKDFPLDLRPQLFILPEDLNDNDYLTNFFLQHGVRQKFSEEDIISVLVAVKDKHASFVLESSTSREIENDLKLCRSILEWLVEGGKTLSDGQQEKILVPVKSTKNKLVLEPCKNCTYCDRDWLRQGGSELDIPGEYQLIHDSVPTNIAKSLGVPALSTCLLSAETLGFEQTGPYEPLTTRLSNILKEYKEGVGVFKELIQNADDAGASKVRFLVDWRESRKESLLSPDMEHCQGPALWAYNDAVFTDKDFENINKLAGATKVEDLAKIGRFGLGFNAVYHLTDVPSFVSREYFVVFDPNVHHLQSHITDRSRPGIRINLANNPRPLSAFEDQFQPYHAIFECDTQCRESGKFHCNGTLFRFPFRTLHQASKSEICQKVYDEEKVKEIVGSLRESVSLLLLYTQHVNEVELYELSKNNKPEMMQLVLSVKKSVPQDTYNEGSVHTSTFVRECSDWWRQKLASGDHVPASPSRSEMITIDNREMMSNLFGNTEQSVKRETWLVSSCVGTESSARLALGEGREHGLLPCGGAATKLSNVAEEETMDGPRLGPEAITGEAFCFLPLSIATGLPVHINGYFAITSNRRSIWERSTSDQRQPIEVQWNESLMEDTLANAYIQLLEDIKRLLAGKSYSFQKLWPCYGTLKSSTWGPLVKSVYSKLVRESLPLLWSNGKWLDIHSGYILDEDLRKTPRAVETLNYLEVNVFDLTEEICSTLAKSGEEDTLKSRTLTMEDFFKKFVFPNIAKFPVNLRDHIVWFGLDRIFKGKDELIPLFKESSFVPTDEGQLKKPSEIYDPNEVLLQHLFLGETNKFPTKDFASEHVLSTLKQLGLRTRSSVTSVELLAVAETISSSSNSASSTRKIQALVDILQDNSVYLNQHINGNETLKDKLLQLKWLPRAKTPPESCLFPESMPWFNNDTTFFAPPELRSKPQTLLVGSSMPIMDVEMSDSLQDELSLTSHPPIAQVITHLKTAVEVWQQHDHKKATSKFQDMFIAIYHHLSRISRNDVADAINDASLKQWIWHGTGFCSPAQVALEKDFPLDLRPQLFLLPDYLNDGGSLTKLFLQHGVQQKFSEEDIISVLVAIKDKHGNPSMESNTSKEVESDLKLCRSILEWLVEEGKTLSDGQQEKILVPVKSTKNKLVLEPCKNCTYCDRDWLRQGGSELDIPGDYHLIHDSVPTNVAKSLGVPALSTCLLSAETLGFEQTGPYEPLTTRLSNILKEYKEGVGVFKELIQNADDAGASKVRFLVDWRESRKESLLSPDMEHCQGPALWAYNDAVFTDKDFENINKLAGATKVEDLAKIGRFGLGFNAVYHLTDVPSFVSREYFVVFDPNVHHLQSHITDRSRPGIRINLAKNPRPLSAFEDQFQPYHAIFDCDTQGREGGKFHYDGTLFRFPFRTLHQASNSEICQKVYDEEKVKEIVGSLTKSASLLLLYTQHVNEVEVYELSKDNKPEMMQLVLSVKKSVPQDTYNEGSVHMSSFVRECSNWWRQKLASGDDVPASPSRSELITIDNKEMMSNLFGNTEQSVKRETWLVSSCVGTESSARLALGEGREHGLLPCGGAATKLSNVPEEETMDGPRLIPEAITGEAFCFLPLSIATGLPVHINGYFAITSNRRSIWERSTSDQRQPIEVQWNESLMEDTLANAYIQLLEDIKRLLAGKSYSFQKLWPCYSTLESSTWGALVKSIYSKLVKESLPLLWSNGKWLDIHSGYILDEHLKESPTTVETLNFLGENIFDLTPSICSTLKQCGQEDTLQSRTLTMEDFFKEFVFPNIAKFPVNLRDPIVWFGLDRIFKGTDELIPLFKESSFVPTDEGQLKKPSEIYDPNDVLLQHLFLGETNKFPTKDFASEHVLSTLKQLGLRTRSSVTSVELLDVAETISSSSNSASSTRKIQALVDILQDNSVYLNQHINGNETLKDKLLQLKWLPRAKTPPKSCLFPESMPWFNSDTPFFAPTELRSNLQSLLVGSSMPIMDVEMSDSLENELSLTSDPPIPQVISQLTTAAQVWQEQDHKKATSKFEDMLVAIYHHLSQISKDKVADAINDASLKQWIWHGTGFCSPAQVALEKDFPLDLRPQLFLLPDYLNDGGSLTKLFLQHGVQQKFLKEDIISVLVAVRDKHGIPSMESNTSKEVESDLKLCRSILEWLVEKGKTLSDGQQEEILVPVQSNKNKLVLEPCKNCTYCDRDWLCQGGSELDIPGDYHLIHDSVPTNVAKSLGVPALSTCLLSAETLGFEQTGPYEPLTTRLSNILKEYKEGVGVFKELIQNGDDAGASKVRFLVDWREGRKESLLSPDMEHCQGPALWAYNDAVFTDKDFENINKLAGATKVEDLAKIGRFGLGFNAVYHLTDVPSFVSREYLVVFDPNVHHLQSHIKDRSRPGIRINLANNPRPLSAFEDQFQPYHAIFDCDTQCKEGGKFHYDGTLFRFPFRTLHQARKSEICQKVYDEEKVKEIVGSLTKSASLLLLYTQHVNEVEVYELSKDNKPEMMQLVLSVKKSVPQETYNEGSVSPFITECSDWWRKVLKSEAVPAGPSRLELITINISEMVTGLSSNKDQSRRRETWLVSSCVGTDSSARLALDKGRTHGLLPCAGAATKLSNVSEDETMDGAKVIPEAITGEAFCFLPLSIATGLPVHINGYFAITSNRRSIWERSTSDQRLPIEVQWNESLMEDALSIAYIRLLEKMKHLHEEKSLQRYYFHMLWPCYGTLESSTWGPLVKSVYSKLVKESLPLLWSNGKWLDIHSGYILDEDLRKTPGAVETLNYLEVNVFDLTEEICSTLAKSGEEDTLESRTLTMENFLKEFFFPNITKLPQDLRDPIVCFCLDLILIGRKEIASFVKENSCIQCSVDGVHLAKPHELINPEGAAADLFSAEDNRFPIGEDFLTSNRFHVLEELGMVKDQLSWDEISERAKSIEKLAMVSYERGLGRARNLIKYLNKMIEKLPKEDGIETILRSTKFLPSMSKPPSCYGLPWKGSEYEKPLFYAPNNLFLSKNMNLVGSCFLIVDDSDQSGCGRMEQKVKQLLGFYVRRPHNDQVLLQLDTTINTWSELSDESKKFGKSKVELVCKSIYSHFDEFVSNAVKKADGSEAVDYLKAQLDNKTWLFVHGTFVSSDKVASEWRGKGAPFLYGLPEEYSNKYQNLIQVAEVKKCFNETDFVNAVNKLRDFKEGSPLTDDELSIAVCFLSELKNSKQEFLDTNADRLFSPDNNKVLSKADELSINNTPWLRDRGEGRYVHKHITNDLAFKLGAKSLLERRRKKYSKHFGIPFGQHEKLTDRLKNILKSYPCDSGILKELVQNADDAKATEIHFVYDTRTLPHKRVIQNNAAEIQGPALCVYNDRHFSDEDFKGIQRLGIGSKSDDPEKTGQYGVGFNAVYHLTDCPSFLSNGDTLCVLDPHCRYAPEATSEFPGEMFRPVDAEFKEDFADALSGYLGQYFELKGSTMFRLPLRNERRSQHSLLSQTDANTKILELLESFRYEAKNSLLFLNHVKKISISQIVENGQIERQYEVSSIMDEEDERKRHNISSLIKKYKDVPTRDVPWKGITYPMILSDSNKINEKWLVHQCFGVNQETVDVDDDIPDGRSYGLLPHGGVAALVSSNRSSKTQYQTRHVAYCFLPLPVYTSLPVHVNGHFALDSARRGLWKDTDVTKPLTKWNNLMKSHVLAPGYASLILEAQNYMPCCEREPEDKMSFFPSETTAEIGLYWYHKLFPNFSDSKDEWKILAIEVYRFLGSTRTPVLPLVVADKVDNNEDPKKAPRRIRSWLPVQEGFFLDSSKTKVPLWKVLLQIRLPVLVSSPLTICNGFKEAKITPSMVSPESIINALRNFCCENSKCEIGNLPSKIEDTLMRSTANLKELIRYCQTEKTFASLLIGLPLLLTADGILRVFNQNKKVYCSQFSDLFPRRAELFVHPDLVSNLLKVMRKKNEEGKEDKEEGKKEKETPQVLLDLTASSLASFMSDVFPLSMRGVSKHQPFPEGAVFSEEWLRRLWLFLQHFARPERDKTLVSLDALKEWPIIPTKCQKLVTIENAKTVLDMRESGKESGDEKKVRECLKKLNCPSLDTDITFKKSQARSPLDGSTSISSYFSRYRSTATGLLPSTTTMSSSHDITDGKKAVTDPYVAHPHSVADILQVLDYMRKTDDLNVTKLSNEEISKVLQFIQGDYENLKPKKDFDEILKNLPLFKSINNSHYSLSSFSSYAIVPGGVPTEEIEKLQVHTECLFLHSDALPTLASLLEGLGAGAKRSVSKFYAEYILPNFSIFSCEAQLKYLTHIRNHVFPSLYKEKEKEVFLNCLKRTACIPRRNGELHRASEFYDPRNSVFRIMLEEHSEHFPPSPFNETEWLDFLIHIGLQSDVNENIFLQFCQKVASVGNQSQLDEINKKRSKELVRYLLTNHHLHESSFLTTLSTVKFIASKKVESHLLSLYKQYQCSDENQHPPFLQFSNSVPWEYHRLVWTSASLLPKWAEPEKEIVCENSCKKSFSERLHIRGPSVETVISHLQNISGPLGETSKKEEALPHPGVLRMIMTSIYEFFQGATGCSGKDISDNCDSECKTIGRRLETTPCILVEDNKVLVRGDQLSFKVDPDKSLRPFLYAVPRDYGSYEHILKRLGATEEITSVQLAKVFKTMKDRCKEKMHPEYESKAQNATYLLFKSIVKESAASKGESKIAHLAELYLPSEDKRLIKSNELLCKVPPRHIETVAKLRHSALLSLEKCGLSREREKEYLEALPEHLRPKPFHDVVREKLDPSCLRNICKLCRESENENCEFIKKHIMIMESKEFQDGIVRLFKHQKNSNELTEEEKEKSSRVGTSKVDIKCMETIKVHLILAETSQALENSSAKRPCYAVREKDSWTLYIQHDNGGKSKLSMAINMILDWHLNEKCLLVIADMLSCASTSEIADTLNSHDIERDVAEEEIKIGREVPVVFHYLMQQNPLFVFHKEELVAFGVELRDDSEDDVVAVAVENEDVKYVLVKVIRCVTSSQGGNTYDFEARYLIDLGNEEKEVSVLDLYKFYQNDPDENPITDMVPFTGDTSRKPTNLDEAKREISEALRAAWRLPPDMRRKVIRRLYLRWHPDKNPNNVEFATEMMAFLLSEIKRMEEEEQRLSEEPVHFNFDGWDNRASRERDTYRNYRNHCSGGSSRSFSATPNYTNPNPSEARRWLEQSENDLKVAQLLLTATSPFNASACFFSHQIVEKSLKAALYAKCGLDVEQLRTHEVQTLAQMVNLARWPTSNLTQLAAVVANYYLPTRYPNRQPYPTVPANAFSREQATTAVQSAKEVLEEVKAVTRI